MINLYKTRENGATVTVFVPYDCGNNCPFCINKKEYANPEGFSTDKIIESIRIMHSITPRCDFVFTGGEPLANLVDLQRMLDEIPSSHRIFINTTLPTFKNNTEADIYEFCERNKDKISCLNISRHLKSYVVESRDEFIASLPVKRRINCVLYSDYPREKLIPFIERFKKHNLSLQFRFDYTETTPENLYDRDEDRIFQDLCKVSRYTGLDGCRMRCGYHYDYEGLEMTYHKTLPYSTIREVTDDGVSYDILYDILIKQNGEIHSDWTDVKLDVDRYREVTFEPDDNKWLEKIS